MFKTDTFSPMQRGRLRATLDKQYRFDGNVKTLRQHIEALAALGPLELSEGDGMANYSRTHFNRLPSQQAQDIYIARLKDRRCYYVNGWEIPKLVYDAISAALANESSDILHQNREFWVAQETNAYVVYREGATHATSDSTYHKTPDGLSIAIARCDYLARRAASQSADER